MAGEFRTDTNLMHQAAKDVDNTADTLAQELSALMTSLGPLEEEWRGRAGARFDELKQLFNTRLRDLHASLEQLASFIDKNSTQYSDAQYSAHQTFDSVGADLGSGTPRTNITAAMIPRG
ncbi:WXG100 family type VII secretion target [Allocatelliglobosispora scoriae]|uniref:WXG100 family type VII secretion target n=1 Tax=Allocatelliglobosispora scoriae TaxID=643052 RepID=A0A841BGZ2_9ACTN|nr:WXG100 family type VII secretion target [Allocatelliglobosispora scoriae]MBB5867554.1 WXG100 family type VII secretion target [Allocatelliglobosispora scoriae]